jgi:hypothetical protein
MNKTLEGRGKLKETSLVIQFLIHLPLIVVWTLFNNIFKLVTGSSGFFRLVTLITWEYDIGKIEV